MVDSGVKTYPKYSGPPPNCRNTSGGVGGFHQLHDYSECNNAVVQKSSFC